MTIGEKVTAELWPEDSPMEYLEGGNKTIPSQALPHDVLERRENWPDRPDAQDAAAYHVAYGMAWAIAKIENPFARGEELSQIAESAAIEACQCHAGGEGGES